MSPGAKPHRLPSPHHPQGPSFSVEGNLVKWQRWQIRVGFNFRWAVSPAPGWSLDAAPLTHRCFDCFETWRPTSTQQSTHKQGACEPPPPHQPQTHNRALCLTAAGALPHPLNFTARAWSCTTWATRTAAACAPCCTARAWSRWPSPTATPGESGMMRVFVCAEEPFPHARVGPWRQGARAWPRSPYGHGDPR